MRYLLALLFLAAVAPAQTINLDQNWQLLPDPDAKYTLQSLPKDGWRPVRVGISWNAQFEDMRDFGGAGWYRTTFTVPQFSIPHHVLLKFGACDYYCEVFVNGGKAGDHEGGYTPFEIEVRDPKPTNDLLVRVSDPPRNQKRNEAGMRQFMYDEVPHGKQNWYVQTGGLWQPVAMLIKPRIYVKQVHVTTEPDGHFVPSVVLGGVANGICPPFQSLRMTVFDPQGSIVDSTSAEHSCDDAYTPPAQSSYWREFRDYQVSLPTKAINAIVAPRFWSPDAPQLYRLRVEVNAESSAPDSAEVHFGFRQLTTRAGKLYLNGKPFYMIGALDQDFYPATIYTPPSPEYLRDEMRKAKALGLNTLRCHIKVCTPDYLDAADEVGMLIWYEIPSWNDEHHWTQEAADRGMHVFREALERDWNHPSLAIQSIINESWGADLKDPQQRKWLAGAYDEIKKAVAPLGRLVVDNSACCENFHVKTDLADFHQYYSIPDHAEQWSKWVQDFASRPKWIWSPYGDAQSTGGEPLIVSEFGNWGLPKLPCGGSDHQIIGTSDQRNNMAAPPLSLPNLERQGGSAGSSDDQMTRSSDCTLPWWFSRDFNGREITMPAGVIDRFHQFKLDRIFSSYNELAEATQWHEFESLKYEIEQMRAQPNIKGYIITEFTDVNWESNGLMDIWRNPKVYAKELSEIQQPDFIKSASGNSYPGSIMSAELPWSHFSSSNASGSTRELVTDWGAYIACPTAIGRATNEQPQPAAGAVEIGSCSFINIPATDRAVQHFTTTRLRTANGRLLAENQGVLNIFPKQAVPDVLVALATDLPYTLRVLHNSADGPVSVTRKWDQTTEQRLSNGGTVILLADSADALPPSFPIQLKPRANSNYNGDWISNFNWILPSSPVFQDIAFNKIMGFEAQAVTANYVLLGVKPEQFDDVLSGAFYGWIHDNAALVLQAKYGKGKLLITTLRFDQYGKDPYATYLLDNIIRYVASPQFAPKLTLSAQ